MKVLVIGATGGTGKLAIAKLLSEKHRVTAFARDPSAVPAQPNLTVVQGDGADAASLERAVAGQEAVLSAFGPRSIGKTTLQETFMRNLIAAMHKHGVKRLINLSAWGAGDSRRHSTLMMKVLLATLLKQVFIDKDRGEELLVTSPLDYVNVRPGRLLDSPARGGVKANLDGQGLKPELTRADLADFMVAQLTASTWVRKSPILGY